MSSFVYRGVRVASIGTGSIGFIIDATGTRVCKGSSQGWESDPETAEDMEKAARDMEKAARDMRRMGYPGAEQMAMGAEQMAMGAEQMGATSVRTASASTEKPLPVEFIDAGERLDLAKVEIGRWFSNTSVSLYTRCVDGSENRITPGNRVMRLDFGDSYLFLWSEGGYYQINRVLKRNPGPRFPYSLETMF